MTAQTNLARAIVPDLPETALSRAAMGAAIATKLEENAAQLAAMWQGSAPISYFFIDDVLPEAWTHAIRAAFPDGSAMTLKESLRERKYIAAQMNRHHPLLEEAIYAFQHPAVVKVMERITGLKALEPDEFLYAGGISMMAPGHFLNPHVDNSHDKFRRRYRVMNLLFYVSPDWQLQNGGNLEVWPKGTKRDPVTLVSRFNRLVVMITHRHSWHSVSPNISAADRCCVSNYYFSAQPPGGQDYFHVTSFRGRPEQPLRDLVLRADSTLRMLVRKFFPQGAKDTGHFYKK